MKRVSQIATILRTKLVEKVHLADIRIIERIGLDGIELIRKICQYRVTPFIFSGLLGMILAPTGSSACDAFLKGTLAVPAIQGTKAIVEGKTLTEAIEEVAKKPSTSVLAGLYAVRIGSQVGLDPRVSFTAGAAAIPTFTAFNKVQNIKGFFFKTINYGIQKIKAVFARIYQLNTTVQQTLLRNDEPISSRKFA